MTGIVGIDMRSDSATLPMLASASDDSMPVILSRSPRALRHEAVRSFISLTWSSTPLPASVERIDAAASRCGASVFARSIPDVWVAKAFIIAAVSLATVKCFAAAATVGVSTLRAAFSAAPVSVCIVIVLAISADAELAPRASFIVAAASAAAVTLFASMAGLLIFNGTLRRRKSSSRSCTALSTGARVSS